MKPSEGQKVVFPRRFAQNVSAIYGKDVMSREQEIKARLHDLQHHNCNGVLTLPSDGMSDRKNCDYCTEMIRLSNELRDIVSMKAKGTKDCCATTDATGCPVGAVLGTADPSGPVGRQWRLLLEMLQVFTPLLERGWLVNLQLDKDGAELISLTGGDCNCPHPKEYDPADGHGFSYLHADHFEPEGEFASDAEYTLAVARAMAERAVAMEGKAKE